MEDRKPNDNPLSTSRCSDSSRGERFRSLFFVRIAFSGMIGKNSLQKGTDGNFTATLPRWTPTSNAVGSLWDYMGMPVGVTLIIVNLLISQNVPTTLYTTISTVMKL